MILEIENYSRIRRKIVRELTKRLERSFKGKILKSFIKEISEETFDKKMQNEMRKARLSLGI